MLLNDGDLLKAKWVRVWGYPLMPNGIGCDSWHCMSTFVVYWEALPSQFLRFIMEPRLSLGPWGSRAQVWSLRARLFRVSIVKRRAYDPGGRGRRAVLSRATHPKTTQTWNLLGFRLSLRWRPRAFFSMYNHLHICILWIQTLDFPLGVCGGLATPCAPRSHSQKKVAKENSIKEDEGPKGKNYIHMRAYIRNRIALTRVLQARAMTIENTWFSFLTFLGVDLGFRRGVGFLWPGSGDIGRQFLLAQLWMQVKRWNCTDIMHTCIHI